MKDTEKNNTLLIDMAIADLQKSAQWLICGNMPKLFQIRHIPSTIEKNVLQHYVVSILVQDFDWRQSIKEALPAGLADPSDLELLKCRSAGIRLWRIASLDVRLCSLYLRWMNNDSNQHSMDEQCRSLVDLMIALQDAEPDAFFPCEDTIGDDQVRLLNYAAEITEKILELQIAI